MKKLSIAALVLLLLACTKNDSNSQPNPDPEPDPVLDFSFYKGADLSYVNEMDDCGAVFKEKGQPKDCYKIFRSHSNNLVRLRLWHTPKWMDNLNSGKRYSDLADVKRSIRRARNLGMHVLLDFHLSDFWADPQRQIVPSAWQPVVDNLPVLKDSLKNYVQNTLLELEKEGLLPEMVQMGNETNKGIMLSPKVDSMGWTMNWQRNSELFRTGLAAVRDVEKTTGKKIKLALHFADPSETEWYVNQFWNNNVRDFDMIGISYYWAWHKPVTIKTCGDVIEKLRTKYPDKDVMIFETGYIWTQQSNDSASNIISETHPDFAPASPENQKKWLVELSKEVKARGGIGVLYWEPAWVSTPCRTPWGQGSHQEHAAFFDFQNNVLPTGGMFWLEEKF